jgi:hypothetical protein
MAANHCWFYNSQQGDLSSLDGSGRVNNSGWIFADFGVSAPCRIVVLLQSGGEVI